MKKSLLVMCLLSIFILPSFTHARGVAAEAEYRAVLLELISVLQEQIRLLQNELIEKPQVVVIPANEEYKSLNNNVTFKKTYRIDEPSDVNEISDTTHRVYFQRLFELSPDELDQKIKKLVVFTESEYDYDAFVETLPPNHETWLYAVNQNMLDDIGGDTNTELIIHELSHMILYEGIVGLSSPSQLNCDKYFEQYGCPNADSYLRKFVEEFWNEEDLDRARYYKSIKNGPEEAYDYYLSNSDRYVSDYATIAPEEDFAETFVFYVLNIPTEGSIAQQKIDFMDSFSELRLYKKKILINR